MGSKAISVQKKPRRGPPAKNAWLRVRMTSADLERCDQAAQRAGLPLSSWVRQALSAFLLSAGLLGCGGEAFALLLVDGGPPLDAPFAPGSSAMNLEPPKKDAVAMAIAPTVDAGDGRAPSSSPDASTPTPDRLEAQAMPEASPVEPSPEAAPDAYMAPDAPAPAPDTAPACTPITPMVQYCGQSTANLIAPGQFCSTSYNGADYAAATPQECQCAETYTCACVLAHSMPCTAPATVFGCLLDGARGVYVHVTCK